MKKLLVGTAAIALGLSALSGAASAQDNGVKLDISGHFKGYVAAVDQDGDADQDGDGVGDDERSFDILRETEIHFSGETTLDNGLTVGVHVESDIDSSDGTADSFDTEEAYAYFSGAWGRVNFGKEDGAAYLLQVAAPSADSNVDGLRQYVQPVNYGLNDVDGAGVGDGVLASIEDEANGFADLLRFDYDQAISGYSNKITYMTPVFNGFQAGISYTPEITAGSNGFGGVNDDDVIEDYGDVIDIAARYEGQVGEVGIALGAGYTTADSEKNDAAPAVLDDRDAWNVGIDLDWGPFGLGFAYTEDDLGLEGDADRETFVVGVDYTTGPFKLGASYYNQDQELDGLGDLDADANIGGNYSFGLGAASTGELETERWTGGVVYTYGPGMTFRGSISYIENELPAAIGTADMEATSVLLGTQINF